MKGSSYHDEQICGKLFNDSVYLAITINKSAAIKRKYQGLRRQFLIDENSDGELMSVELTKRKKYRSRVYRVNLFCLIKKLIDLLLQKKYKNRGDVVRPHEMQYWKDVQLYHMSEESDDESGNPEILVIHKLVWRSEGTHSLLLHFILS